MITVKSYVWPVVRNMMETVGGFLFQMLLGLALGAFAITVVHFLQWYSAIVFILIALCYYVWREAHFAYKFDKDEAERKITEHLHWMSRLPAYWSIEEDQEKNDDSYKRATGEFIKMMELYESKYGKDSFYEDTHNHWITTDKYLRDALINKTF